MRENVIAACVARITSPGSCPGMNAKSLVRTSNPPPVGGVTPALIVTVVPVTAVTVSVLRFASTVGATGDGNQASTGTVALVLMAKSSAQSLANAIAYSPKSGQLALSLTV